MSVVLWLVCSCVLDCHRCVAGIIESSRTQSKLEGYVVWKKKQQDPMAAPQDHTISAIVQKLPLKGCYLHHENLFVQKKGSQKIQWSGFFSIRKTNLHHVKCVIISAAKVESAMSRQPFQKLCFLFFVRRCVSAACAALCCTQGRTAKRQLKPGQSSNST